MVVYIHGLFPLGPCVAKGDHSYIRIGCVCDWNLLQRPVSLCPPPPGGLLSMGSHRVGHD